MNDLSSIFYPERNEYESLVHHFPPHKTIDRDKLAIVFFDHLEDDFASVSFMGNSYQRDEVVSESILQLREVADLLQIPIVKVAPQQKKNIKKQSNRQDIERPVLFVAVSHLNNDITLEICRLLRAGNKVIIGSCASIVYKEEWRDYQDLQREGAMVGPTLQFVDTLLWEEFRIEFRMAKLNYYGLPAILSAIEGTIIPCLKQLETGEPQLRLHFLEGLDGKYRREFALEIDWEPRTLSKMRLVFRHPIEDKPALLWERLFGKQEKAYRFAQTERDYICLQITSEHDVGCCFKTICKDSKKNLSEIARKVKRLEQKSKTAAAEFLKQEVETVLEIGIIQKNSHCCRMYPYRILHSFEWDDSHIREAIKASIGQISM